MQRSSTHLALLGALLATATPLVARAEVYLSEEQAGFQIFPGVKLEAKWLELASSEVNLIEKASGITVRNRKLRVWQGQKGETIFIDQVVGKHDFITYAVGVLNGRVTQIEIMEYRETYGNQVRQAGWRRQFVGKDKTASLKLDEDIKNISGATLSSAHVTAGVKRILQTYEAVKSRL